MMKKNILIFILGIMLTLACSISVSAETNGTCGDSLTWTLDTDGTLTISGTGAMTDYIDSAIPWYEYKDSINKVVINSGATSISYGAFSKCTGLTSITIPDGVTSIGYSAFAGCRSLTSITIPNSVRIIGSGAFSNCTNLISVTIPSNVTSIRESTFSFCVGLTSVTIPNSVTSIGNGAFYGCNSLVDVYYTGTQLQWTAINKGDYNGPLINAMRHVAPTPVASGTCGDSLTWMLVDDGTLTISGTGAMMNYAVSSTAPWHKYADRIKKVVINNGVTSIGDWVFCFCSSLSDITIPNSVTSIGDCAFYDCRSLESIIIPNNITSIGRYALSHCTGLTSITIPNSITSIGDCAFYDCRSLISVIIPNSVNSIGDDVFGGCSSLTGINVANENKNYCSIDGNLFNKDKTTLIQYAKGKQDKEYTIPNGVKNVGNWAFSDCSSLTNVKIPNCVRSIGICAFSDCSSLISAAIPNSVTSIEYRTFYNCSGLTNIAIPDSITSIGGYALYGCSSLTDVYYSGTKAEWKAISIEEYNEELTKATIYYNSVAPTTTPTVTPIPKPTPIPATAAEIERTDTSDSAEYTFSVIPETAYENCYVYAAVYGENGVLLAVNRVPLEMTGNTSISVNKSAKANDALAKVFIWTDRLQPIIEKAEEFPLT